jgi:hypothetical protein
VLYTDLVYLTGDNEEQLHIFASKLGIPRNELLRSGSGTPYYSLWRLPSKRDCLKYNVIIIKRKVLRRFIRLGRLQRKLNVDWMYYRKFMKSWLILIAKHNDLYSKMGFKDISVHVTATGKGCSAWFEDYDYNRATFQLGEKHPEGHCNYPIPPEILDEIKANVRYLQEFHR